MNTKQIKIGERIIDLLPNTNPRKGLRGIDLKRNQGMLFEFPTKDSFITMKGMTIPLDLIFIDKNQVREIVKAKPGDEVHGFGNLVLELNANSNVKVGEKVRFLKDYIKTPIFRSGGKMKVLDENGNVSNILDDSSVIYSRKDTRKLFNKYQQIKSSTGKEKDKRIKELGKILLSARKGHMIIQKNNEQEFTTI